MITVKVYILWTLLGTLGILSLVMVILAIRQLRRDYQAKKSLRPWEWEGL